MSETEEIVLVKLYKNTREKLKQAQAYLTIDLGRTVTQAETMDYLIDGFLSKKGNAPKENRSPHLESPEVPYP